MKKKIISLLICLCTAVSSAIPVLGAEEIVNETPKMLEATEEYGLIAAISDAESYMVFDDNEVTRAEFVSAAMSVLGMSGTSGKLSFTDVKPGTELYGFVGAAVASSFVSDGETFRPDEPILVSEALKICVRMTGYGVMAERAGGYPNGYLSVGASNGILKGISSVDAMNADDAYKLLYNTITADMLEGVYSEQGIAYEPDGSTILSAHKNISTVSGIITSNEYTQTGSVAGAESSITALKDTLGIGGVKYPVSGDYNHLLGYNVNAYVQYDKLSGEGTIVYVHEEDNRVQRVVSGDLEYSDGYLYDHSGNKTKKYKLSRSIDTIVNKKADYSYDLKNLETFSGEAILISNNDTDEYNVISITSYKYIKVVQYDKAQLTIRDMDNAENTIILNEDNICSVYLEEEQAYGTLGDIEVGSYIAAALSKDNEICDITILNRTAEGVVEAVDEDTITVGGIEYTMAEWFRSNDFSRVVMGRSTAFYLGFNDEIIAMSYIESEMLYGYLIFAGRNEDNEDEVVLRIFTQNDEMLMYDCAEKLTVDGNGRIKAGDAYEKYLTQPQLIRFSTNADGEVSVIDLAETVQGYSDIEQDGLADNNSLCLNKFTGSYYFRSNIFYPYFNINGSVIFRIPTDKSRYNDYAIGYSFQEGNISDTAVEAYDVGLDGVAKAIVANVDTTDGANVALINPTVIVVENVSKKVNDDGEVLRCLTGWQSGKFVEYWIENDVEIQKFYSASELVTGDIIRVSLRGDTIVAAVVDFAGDELMQNKGSNLAPFNCRSTACHYQAGSVYSLKDNAVLISRTQLGEKAWDYGIQNLISVQLPTAIVTVDRDRRKIRATDKNELQTYLNSETDASYIVVHQIYGGSRFCAIYTEGDEQ